MYSQATANTRVVGLEIAYMVNTMIVCNILFYISWKKKKNYFVYY